MPFSWSFSFFKKPSHVFIPLQKGLSVFPNSLQQKQKLDLIPQNKLATTVKHFHHYVTHVYNGWRKNVALELCYYMENSLLVDVVHALLYHIVEHQKYFQAIYMGHQG